MIDFGYGQLPTGSRRCFPVLPSCFPIKERQSGERGHWNPDAKDHQAFSGPA